MESFRNFLSKTKNKISLIFPKMISPSAEIVIYKSKIRMYEKHYVKYLQLYDKYNNLIGWITGKRRRCEEGLTQAAKLSNLYYKKIKNILEVINKRKKKELVLK